MIAGAVAPGFEGVRSAFERCFAELGETGASFPRAGRRALGMTGPTLGLAEAYVTRRLGTPDRADALDAALRAAIG